MDRNIFGFFFLLFTPVVFSQPPVTQHPKSRVEYRADYVEMDKAMANGAKRLIGNVVFKHAGATMYCDSAYYFSDSNSLDAYNNVYIVQGDTLHLWGKYLFYNGNTRLAKISDKVKLVDKETVLKAPYLLYQLSDGIGYYNAGGVITNADNKLESREGYYYSRGKYYYFEDSVVITNPDYVIYSDTLKYFTTNRTAWFYGPTEIIGDSNYIYCERGWYNTQKNTSKLFQDAYYKHGEQYIYGDSLFYNRNTGYGRALNNVNLVDSSRNATLFGMYGEYFEKSDKAMVTDSAMLIQVQDIDTLFLHADTIRGFQNPDSSRIIKAYYHVRFFRNNIQGKCDSLTYLASDSVMILNGLPVMWSEENQITSEWMEIYMANKKISHVEIINSSFIVAQKDTSMFDQIKGKNMTGYFKDNELHTIRVKGNGQTVYYPKDGNDIMGVNTAESTDIAIYLTDGKIDRINYITKPDATMHPLDKAPQELLKLKGFQWLEHIRPKSKEDIFRWVE